MEMLSFTELGPLQFGMDRRDVQDRLAVESTRFRKSPFAETDSEDYLSIGLILFYDANDALEFIEAFHPCEPHFRGIQFIGRPVQEVRDELRSKGIEVEDLDGNLDMPTVGIGLYPMEGTVDGICVYRAGYYEVSP